MVGRVVAQCALRAGYAWISCRFFVASSSLALASASCRAGDGGVARVDAASAWPAVQRRPWASRRQAAPPQSMHGHGL